MAEYRNIDTDIVLLRAAERYWNDADYSRRQMIEDLANECYSEREADLAINDYYHVYVYSQWLSERLLLISMIFGVVCLLTINLLRFIGF